jgi:hypothetical protein
VKELRQLIDGMLAAELSETAGDASIAAWFYARGWITFNALHPACFFLRRRLAARPHGSQFPHPEGSPVFTNSQVSDEGRAAGENANDDCRWDDQQ